MYCLCPNILFQISFPGAIPSHVSGHSLRHSFGAMFDNPDLIAACVVGDGEAENGPLATAWHSIERNYLRWKTRAIGLRSGLTTLTSMLPSAERL